MKKPAETVSRARLRRWSTPRAGSGLSRYTTRRAGITGRKANRSLREPRNWILVVELDDVVPRLDPEKPNLFVAVTAQEPTRRYADLEAGGGPAWLRGRMVALRDDLSSGPFMLREEAEAERLMAIKCLRSEGYTVNRNKTVWTVYVIELDPKGSKQPGKGFFYVGMTSKKPEERFEEHVKGKRNKRGPLFSRVVRRYGLRLRLDLAPETVYFDRRSAEAAEKRWCAKLKAEGYNVAGGH